MANAYIELLKNPVDENVVYPVTAEDAVLDPTDNQPSIPKLKNKISELQQDLASCAYAIGTPLQKTVITQRSWTKYAVFDNITIKAGYTYEFSITGEDNNRRYLALCNESGNVIKLLYDKTQDGIITYTSKSTITNCYLDYRSDVKDAKAVISYRIVVPTKFTDIKTELESEIGEYRIVEFTKSSSGYVNTNGDTYVTDGYQVSNPIQIENAIKIITNYSLNSSYLLTIAFFNALPNNKNSFISGTTNVICGGEITVPTNAKYVVVSATDELASSASISVYYSYVKAYNDELSNFDSALKSYYVPANTAIETRNRAINGINGALQSIGAFRTLEFDISNIDRNIVSSIYTQLQTFSFSSSNNEGFAFYKVVDGVETFISGGVCSEVKKVEYVIAKIPDDATIFKVCYGTGQYTSVAQQYDGFYFIPRYVDEAINDIKKLKNNIEKSHCDIILGDKIYAVVGDTIQLFYKSFIDANLNDLVIRFSCQKGKNYPRYWEFTPSENDVGQYPIEISVYTKDGILIQSKQTNLIVKSAVNPTSNTNILCIGDSTMSVGQIPIEASRRFKGTSGKATTPVPLAFSNINFVGRKKNADSTVGWEGTGGWTYGSYISKGVTAIRFTVNDATNLNIDDVYECNGFKLMITEINVTSGKGNIRTIFNFTTPYTSVFDSNSQTGTLIKVSGNGQSSISYTAYIKENYQPLWNISTDTFDVLTYANTYCNGSINIICALLGINSLIDANPFSVNIQSIIDQAKTFVNNIHSQMPNTKIILSTIPLASPNGGIASNYGAGGNSGAYNANGFNHKIVAFNKALIEFAEQPSYSDFVTISNTHAQFDIDNCYISGNKELNTRVSTTEKIQTNAVHPAIEGYWQIADALAFRSIIGILN